MYCVPTSLQAAGGGLWADENAPDLAERNATMWLLEWAAHGGAAGQTALGPSKAVMVNKAAGGWSFGQWEVSIRCAFLGQGANPPARLGFYWFEYTGSPNAFLTEQAVVARFTKPGPMSAPTSAGTASG